MLVGGDPPIRLEPRPKGMISPVVWCVLAAEEEILRVLAV